MKFPIGTRLVNLKYQENCWVEWVKVVAYKDGHYICVNSSIDTEYNDYRTEERTNGDWRVDYPKESNFDRLYLRLK